MLPVVTDVSELYKTADGGAMATLIAKLAIEKSYSSKLEETRNAIQVRVLLFRAFSRVSLVPHSAARGCAKVFAFPCQEHLSALVAFCWEEYMGNDIKQCKNVAESLAQEPYTGHLYGLEQEISIQCFTTILRGASIFKWHIDQAKVMCRISW